MADKRFDDNPADVNPDALDIIPGTDVSLDQDKKYTFQVIADTVAVIIGIATAIKNGLMSSSHTYTRTHTLIYTHTHTHIHTQKYKKQTNTHTHTQK